MRYRVETWTGLATIGAVAISAAGLAVEPMKFDFFDPPGFTMPSSVAHQNYITGQEYPVLEMFGGAVVTDPSPGQAI